MNRSLKLNYDWTFNAGFIDIFLYFYINSNKYHKPDNTNEYQYRIQQN